MLQLTMPANLEPVQDRVFPRRIRETSAGAVGWSRLRALDARGIDHNVRLHIGLEDLQNFISDLWQALKKLVAGGRAHDMACGNRATVD